jgi:HTH-type transcriptional regulator / antitoxin HigA
VTEPRTDGLTPFTPDWAVPPGHILVEALEERDISLDDFAAVTGIDRAQLDRLATGEDALDAITASVLEERLGIPAKFWMRSEQLFRAHLWKLWRDNEGQQ